MSAPLSFQLDEYQGPLDFLLDLIRKQKINIYDIPIASITAQYMEFMENAAALDIELGADFIYMAATLIHIKSKMLLPVDPELEKLSPEEDPRKELVDRLLDHEKFKNAAEMLQQKRMLEEAAWSNPQMGQFLAGGEGPALAVTLFDLVSTFQGVLERVKSRPTYQIDREQVTVQDMLHLLQLRLERAGPNVKLSAILLFEEQDSRRAMLCLFLAILELVKRQAIRLHQADAFGDLMIERKSTFAEAFGSQELLAAVEQEYS